MKIKININEKVYAYKISARNSKFECCNCDKEVYSKKVTENDYRGKSCLRCLFKYLNRILKKIQDDKIKNKKELKKIKKIDKRIKKEEDSIIKVRDKVKEKYEIELIDLEL